MRNVFLDQQSQLIWSVETLVKSGSMNPKTCTHDYFL